jgi:hypothetical protein
MADGFSAGTCADKDFGWTLFSHGNLSGLSKFESKHECIAKLTKNVKNVGKPSYHFAFSQQAVAKPLKLLKLMPIQSVKDFKSHPLSRN